MVTPIQGDWPTFLQVHATYNTPSSTHSTSIFMHLLSTHAPHLGSTLTHHREHLPTPNLPPFRVEAPTMGTLLNVDPLRVENNCAPPISPYGVETFPKYPQQYIMEAKEFIPPC